MSAPKPVPPQCADLRLLPALAPLTRAEYVRWVGWRYELVEKPGKSGKWTKVPYQLSGAKAANNRPREWSRYRDIWEQYRAGRFHGVGMMLLGLDGFAAIDLDHVRDPQTGAALPWVSELIADCGSYCEITPSMEGLRVLGGWMGGKVHRNGPHPGGGKFELFADCERYITFTGLANGSADCWGDITVCFNGLLARLPAAPVLNVETVSDGATAIDIETLSLLAIELITKGTIDGGPIEHRGTVFAKIARELHGRGHGFEAALTLLAKYPDGVQAKYGGRLRKELSRIWGKLEQGTRAATVGGVSLDDFWAYMPQHSYFYTPIRQPWPAASVNSRIGPISLGFDEDGKEVTLAASAWLDRNKPVEQMTWAPGLPMVIKDRLIAEGGWIDRNGVGCLNLYLPPNVGLGDPEQAGKWLEHGRQIYPQDFDHIVKWLAHRRQRPQEKINHALVMGGDQGIGKDTLLEPVKHAIGPWNFAEVSPQQVSGRFNGFLKSVILRISEARDLGDSDRFQFYDHMKAYTAAPPDVLRVDEKYLREHSILNCCGVIVTTNHKADGIYLPADDRRHYVAWSDRKKEDFTETYWKELWRWYGDGGFEHVAAYLDALNLSEFNAKAPPTKTEAFWSIVNASRSPETAEMADALDALERPDTVTLEDLQCVAKYSFGEWLRDGKNARRIPHRLEESGYVAVRNTGDQDGLWKVGGRRRAVYAKAELTLRARAEAVGGRIDEYNRKVTERRKNAGAGGKTRPDEDLDDMLADFER